MLESINKLKNLNRNGKESTDIDWESPAQLIIKTKKEERKKLYLVLFISNLFLFIVFSINKRQEPKANITQKQLNHSVIKIEAQLLIPLTDQKTEITIFTKEGSFFSKAFLLPKNLQHSINENGPWKIEIPTNTVENVLRSSDTLLKIAPKETKDYSSKKGIYEIKF